MQGIDTLPQQYVQHFSGTLEEKKKKKHIAKLKWLTTVWSLQEAANTNYFHHNCIVADSLTRYIYLQWKDITNTCT